MKKRLLVPFLLTCSFCLGQSTITTPGAASPQAAPDASAGGDAVSPATVQDEGDTAVTQSSVSAARRAAAPVKAHSTVISEPDDGEDDVANSSAKPKAPRLELVRTDFQVFAEDSVGHSLEVFGRKLFDEVPSTFAPLQRVPVPADYAIGPGDELLIRAWGKIDLDARVIVDRNGQISLAKVGVLNVAGLHYDQLEGYLRTAVGSLYRDFELNVALGQLRSIQILILGNASRPGSYTLSSLSTLVDALFASGGPSATGTMRHVELRRVNRQLVDFDVYDLQQRGDKSHDVQLLPGDEIYIPPIGPQVAIVGNVNQPGIFELKGDTTVGAAIEGAGGLTNLAATARVLLERIEDHKLRRVDEFALDAPGLARMLRDGDLLRIHPISPQFENAVTIRGNVAAPGRFPWHEGMRVSDLIPTRQFLLTSGHWNLENHLTDERHTDMMADLGETDAEIDWDYAAIERLDQHDLSTRLIAFNLGNAIDAPGSSDNQVLKVGDVLTVFSRRDLPLPLEKHSTFVRIGGEVNAPGVYRVAPGDTLRNLVDRAGGLTAHSYLYASQFTRASTRRVQEEQLRLSVGRMQKELIAQFANVAPASETMSATQQPGSRAQNQQLQLGLQQTLVDRLSAAQPSGRVVLGIKADARAVADIPDFPLEDGDSFYIPPRLGTVQVAGEVYNENAFRYQGGKELRSYLNDSGGATRLADLRRIFLIRADGTVMSRQNYSGHWPANFERIVLMPGDAIIVPPKLKAPGGFMEELPLLTQVLSQTAMTGAVLSLIQ